MANADKQKRDLARPAKTAGYKPVNSQWFRRPRDLPPMTWLTIESMMMEPTIRLGLAMRAAPVRNCQFAYKNPGDKDWTEGVRASSPMVGNFVYNQLKRIWRDINGLLISQLWGWSAAEVLFELTSDNAIQIRKLLPRHPRDCRALVKSGDVVGVQFNRLQNSQEGSVSLLSPRCVFHRHNPEPGAYYGTTILEGAYSPWWDKWGRGGALEVRRLTMMQNSINGRRLKHPLGTIPVTQDDGSQKDVPTGNVAREMVETMMAGSVVCMPSTMTHDGKPLWELEEATAMTGLDHVLKYPQDLDKEQLRGMEIPDDVLSADNSGAWEGKKVPMMAFYNGLDNWVLQLVTDIEPVLKHLVLLNFGPKAWFCVETKPLAEQVMEQAKANEPKQEQPSAPQPPQQPYQPQRQPEAVRMSLDPVQAVGEGVLSAADLVSAARAVIHARLAAENPHSFSSTQFDLPSELAFEVRQLGEQIPSDDLAEDGRELNPHVTIKYGLHTNDAEDVRAAVNGESPVAIQLGKCSVFEVSDKDSQRGGAKFDVVKIEVESKALHQLNKRISEALPCTDTFPEYKPHITIAYVKPGLGKVYAEKLNSLQGRVAVFDRLTFSNKHRIHFSIPLTGNVTRFSSDS